MVLLYIGNRPLTPIRTIQIFLCHPVGAFALDDRWFVHVAIEGKQGTAEKVCVTRALVPAALEAW